MTYPITPRVVRSQLGFEVEIRDYAEHIQSYIYWLGRFEPRESAVVRNLVQPGDCVIDAGANLGWFTLLASSIVGTTGKIFAFEPSGANRRPFAPELGAERRIKRRGAPNCIIRQCRQSKADGH